MSILSKLPIWAKVIPVVAAVAGMAIIGAGITGDNAVKVQEPVTFGTASNVSDGAGASATAVIYNDETSYIVSVQTFPGDMYQLQLFLNNESGVTQVHRLTIDAPEGFRFQAGKCSEEIKILAKTLTPLTCDGGSELSVAQESNLVIAYTVDSGADGTTADDVLRIGVEVLPQVVPATTRGASAPRGWPPPPTLTRQAFDKAVATRVGRPRKPPHRRTLDWRATRLNK